MAAGHSLHLANNTAIKQYDGLNRFTIHFEERMSQN